MNTAGGGNSLGKNEKRRKKIHVWESNAVAVLKGIVEWKKGVKAHDIQ